MKMKVPPYNEKKFKTKKQQKAIQRKETSVNKYWKQYTIALCGPQHS